MSFRPENFPAAPTHTPIIAPNAPTHTPLIRYDSTITDILNNSDNISDFIYFLWVRHCAFFGSNCTEYQKQPLQKYYPAKNLINALKSGVTQNAILSDLAAFTARRGSSLLVEFRAWISSLSKSQENEIIRKATHGGVRHNTKKSRSKSRKQRTSSKRGQKRQTRRSR